MQRFGVYKIIYILHFWNLCSSKLHLFDKEFSKNSILWNITNQKQLFLNVTFITQEFSGYFDKYKFQKNSVYLNYKSFVNVFAVTFDEFNASLLNKTINSVGKYLSDPKRLNSSVHWDTRLSLQVLSQCSYWV